MGLQEGLGEGHGRATSAGPAPDHNATNPSLLTNPHGAPRVLRPHA